MYEEFYGLRENPFSADPNSRYVYESRGYRTVLETLLSGLARHRGIMLVDGAAGTGKTTLCFDLPARLDPTRYHTAVIFDPFLDVEAMLQALLAEFGATYAEGAPAADLLERLRRFLLARREDGQTCVAVFDESWHLAPELLARLRALADSAGDDGGLLRLVLVGQQDVPQQGRQQVPATQDPPDPGRCVLANLDADELAAYVQYRLAVAGAGDRVQFTDGALERVFQATGGVPRMVNQACDRALLAGYVAKVNRIGRQHVEQALAD
jgi:general secretion pathway protein A